MEVRGVSFKSVGFHGCVFAQCLRGQWRRDAEDEYEKRTFTVRAMIYCFIPITHSAQQVVVERLSKQ